ncbi:MAG: acyl-CoA dehydrogenase family protein [Acetobacteraceae bacterium]
MPTASTKIASRTTPKTAFKAPKATSSPWEALNPLLANFRRRMRQYDDAAEFPAANFEELRKAGLLTLSIPKEFGGHGFWQRDRFVEYYRILEELAKADPCTGQLLQIHTHASGIVAWHATPDQRAIFLPEFVEQGKLVCSAGSEADPKSTAPAAGRAELARAPGGYRLSCFKHFASLAAAADYYLIWTLAPGTAPPSQRQLFVLVPRDGEGVELVNEWDTLGMRSTVSWGIRITDHFVPEERVIGEPGGWLQDPRTFTLAYVANHLGSAKGAFEVALDFVRARTYLSQGETVKVAIGDLASRLYAAESAFYAAAEQWEVAAVANWQRSEHDRAEMMSLQALHIAKRCSLDVSERVFDICGARATFKTMPLEQFYRDIRTFTLHFRDDLYMARVAEGLLDRQTFEAKGKYKRIDKFAVTIAGA